MSAVARTVVQVDFRRKRTQPYTEAPTLRVPRIVRLLVLSHEIQRQIRKGTIRNHADAARRLGLTRARLSQITSLLLLAPQIQESILNLPPVVEGRDRISERKIRNVVAEPFWPYQLRLWNQLRSRDG